MVSIPQAVFDKYNEFADDFINSNFGVRCNLIYPFKKIQCPNCVMSSFRGGTNVYRTGGPLPFTFGPCPLCAGEGFQREEATPEVIKLRVYYRPKDWVKVSFPTLHGEQGDVPFQIPDGTIQVIGFMSDLPKVERADKIQVNIDQDGYKRWTYQRLGEALPHGFKQDRYFICFLKRVI